MRYSVCRRNRKFIHVHTRLLQEPYDRFYFKRTRILETILQCRTTAESNAVGIRHVVFYVLRSYESLFRRKTVGIHITRLFGGCSHDPWNALKSHRFRCERLRKNVCIEPPSLPRMRNVWNLMAERDFKTLVANVDRVAYTHNLFQTTTTRRFFSVGLPHHWHTVVPSGCWLQFRQSNRSCTAGGIDHSTEREFWPSAGNLMGGIGVGILSQNGHRIRGGDAHAYKGRGQTKFYLARVQRGHGCFGEFLSKKKLYITTFLACWFCARRIESQKSVVGNYGRWDDTKHISGEMYCHETDRRKTQLAECVTEILKVEEREDARRIRRVKM